MYPSAAYDRPGTIYLKSNVPMEYSRSVLSNKWHIKREAEPRDFELWSGQRPNLHQSTYKYISKDIPSDKLSSETETRSKHEEALRLLEEYKHLDDTKKMVDMSNKNRVNEKLDSYGSDLASVLPTHPPGHNKHHLETTYVKDYVHPYPELLGQKSAKAQNAEFKNSLDNSMAFRRMVSQFSDIDAPKRAGINTFHVQHGEYPNQLVKNRFHSQYNSNIFG